MSYGLRIIGVAAYHRPSPFDGQWVAECDPNRPGVDPEGCPMFAHLIGTDNPAEAMRFVDAKAAWATWTLQSDHPHPDGKPNRPLTAFTVVVEELPE